MSTLQSRIKLLRGATPQAKFASELGVTQSTLGRYERGDSAPDVEFVQIIYEKLGVEPKWLIFGEGPMRPDELGGDTLSISSESPPRPFLPMGKVVPGSKAEVVECMDCHLAMIPMVEARLSAGTGSFENGGAEERRYAFRTDFLSRKGQLSRMVLMRVEGDSMEPEIKHGDMVLIDQSQTTPRPGAMFAIGVEDLVYIKMVDSKPGKIILKSLNPAYEALEIDSRGDLYDGIRIIGKAIWLGREMR